MRWTEPIDYSEKRMWNRDHEEKHSGFLFFPKTLGNETRWLEFAEWTERFHINEKGKKDWSTAFWSGFGD